MAQLVVEQQKKVAEARSQVRQLRREVVLAAEASMSARQQRDQAHAEIEQLRGHNAQLRLELQQTEASLGDMQQEVAASREQVATWEAASRDAQHKLGQVRPPHRLHLQRRRTRGRTTIPLLPRPTLSPPPLS